MQLDDWVLCRIYKKSKCALSSTEAEAAETTSILGEVEQAEENQFKDILLPHQNTLMSQKSVSFSNLLDAMDYSMLSNFLSENHSNPPGFGSSTSAFNNLDHQSSQINTNNSYMLFQKNPQNMENMRLKQQLSNIDEDTLYPSKKYSCNFPNINAHYENPQWNNLMKQSMMNQQFLLAPHFQFQG